MVLFAHNPEQIVFAIDLDADMSTEVTRGVCRLDVVKHAVTTFVLAKKRMCAQHKFAIATLVQDEAVLLPFSITSNTDEFLECLAQLQPAEPAAAAEEQQFITSGSSSSGKAFDFGSLINAVQPLVHQQQQYRSPQQQQQQQQKVLQVAGGVLSPAPTLLNSTAATPSSSSSNSSQHQPHKQQHSLRVILIYGRSHLPAPKLDIQQQQQGLVIDCLYVHTKPQAGLNHAQEVYGALEELVDGLGARAGHAPFIYEATAGRTMKLLSCMAMLLAHPKQRKPQVETQPPLDIAAAPIMQLPSDLANLASGVPIMPASKLPAPAAASAWSKPLVVTNDTVTDSVGDAALSAWGLPAAAAAAAAGDAGPWGAATAAAGSSSSGAAEAWGVQSTTAATTAAAGGSAWSDPWDDAGKDTPAFSLGTILAQQQTHATPAAAVRAEAGNSGSSSKKTGTVTGVPAGVVQGVPDCVPSYDLDSGLDAGTVVGFAAPIQEKAAAAAEEVETSLDGGAGSSAAAAAAEVLGDGGNVSQQTGRSSGGLEDDGLEGLAAALMGAAVEEKAAATAAGQQAGQQ